MTNDYIIGDKYEIHIPKESRFFSCQLPEGFVGTLLGTFKTDNNEIWGNFEECTRYNYKLTHCIKIEPQSRINRLLKALNL